MRLFANANYDFLSKRNIAYIITAVFLAAGLLAMAIQGIDYSVEFTGGIQMEIETDQPADIAAIRAGLAEHGMEGAEILTFGSNREIAIRAEAVVDTLNPDDTQAGRAAVTRALDDVLGPGTYRVVGAETVSPRVGSALQSQAFFAILLSFGAVLVYLAVRFEWRFGLAAVFATAHDLLATLAFIALLKIEISLFVVAALLSIVGYSLNDTIVIFDRVRENLHKSKQESFAAILNRSVNETLPRTVLTGGTAIGTLVAMAVLGGTVLRPFALIMLFGVVIGTFSSIFIASPILLAIEERWPGPHARGVRVKEKGAAAPKHRKAQPAA